MPSTLFSDLYVLHCQTNLHAGSGSESYGIIDNNVQRDAATGYPTIHASSLKGAIKEYFEVLENMGKPEREKIFGNDINNDAQSQGKIRFISAHLLSLPVRSNTRPFYRAVSVDIIEEFKSDLELHNYENDDLDFAIDLILREMDGKTVPQLLNDPAENVILEDEPAESLGLTLSNGQTKEFEKFFGNHLAIYPTGVAFGTLMKNLPVQARNYLENGESKNLWYEEYVPRESRFYCFCLRPEDITFTLDTKLIQVGANATVGFGYTKFSKL